MDRRHDLEDHSFTKIEKYPIDLKPIFFGLIYAIELPYLKDAVSRKFYIVDAEI